MLLDAVMLPRHLLGNGLVALVSARVSNAKICDDIDPEASGECRVLRVAPMAVATFDQVLATLEFAKTPPFVDATRGLVMAQPVGASRPGLAAIWRGILSSNR